MRRGVGRKEVSVTATDFPDKRRGGWDDFRQRILQARAAVGDPIHIFGSPGKPQASESPSLSAPIATIRRLMSVGFTPLMRLAWPSVSGLISASFTALSRRSPGILE